MGRTRSREAIAPLLTLLDDDALAMHCYRSLVTLAESWSDEVRQALAPLTTRPLRPHTVRAWAEIAGEDAVGVIRRAMHDADPAVRAAGAQASRFTPSETLSTLRQALMDESAVVRRGAVRTLGQLAAADAEPLLTRALADSDASVLALACEAAGRAGALSLVPRLLAHSRHADAAVVLGALEALGLLGQLDDDTLIAAATHADAEVLKLVFSFGADRALLVSHAHAQLGHARWDVRVAAARLLAVSATRDALPAMLDAVTREADDVARGLLAAAAEALAKRV